MQKNKQSSFETIRPRGPLVLLVLKSFVVVPSCVVSCLCIRALEEKPL